MITHVGAGVEANADRGRRAPAPELPGRRRRLAGCRATSTSAGSTWPATPSRWPRRRSRCCRRRSARAAGATIVLDPSQLYLQIHESCGHPTELDRVFGTEASYAGTSFLTTDKLDCGLPLRLGAHRHRRRRDGARRHGHLRLGRRGRRGPGRPARQGGHLRRLPLQPRDGAPDRPALAAARCGPTAGTASRSSG